MSEEMKQKWINALLSGEYKQQPKDDNKSFIHSAPTKSNIRYNPGI